MSEYNGDFYFYTCEIYIEGENGSNKVFRKDMMALDVWDYMKIYNKIVKKCWNLGKITVVLARSHEITQNFYDSNSQFKADNIIDNWTFSWSQ